MVIDLDELDHYKWTGHAVIMGNVLLETQNTAAILERFGNITTQAQLNYRQFVFDGISAGNRDDLVGGGLKRSQGERPANEYESYDDRVLGCGDFVDSMKLDSGLRDKMKSAITLEKLLHLVATALSLDLDSIKGLVKADCRRQLAE
jgi:hypothetical protein